MAAIVPSIEEGNVSGNVSGNLQLGNLGNLQLGATHDVAALGLRQQKMLETGDEDVDECNFAAGEHDSRTSSATSSIPPGAVQVSGGLTFSFLFRLICM